MNKYLVVTKCRLVDVGDYLDENTVYIPKDDNYERSSRSLAAAKKAGWLRKITDAEAEAIDNGDVEFASTPIEEEVQVRQTLPRPEKKIPPTVIDDAQLSQMADEVISSDAIMEARDRRRQAATPGTKSNASVISENASNLRKEIRRKQNEKKDMRISGKVNA